MPTNPVTFAPDEIDMVWKEPYLTEGLNEKAMVIPRGVYRGFEVIASGVAMSVTIVAALPKFDHVAIVETQNNYSLTVRRSTGNFDVSLAAYVLKTVMITLYATYSIGTPTAAFVRVFLDTEYAALTPAERAELTVLATVVTPAAGVIPTANVTYELRTYPWQNLSPNFLPWRQLIRNGTFEIGRTLAPNNGAIPYWEQSPEPVQGLSAYFRRSLIDPAVNTACLEWYHDQAGTYSRELYQFIRIPVSPGQRLKLSVRLKRLVIPTSVNIDEIVVQFGSSTGAVVASATLQLNLVGGVDATYNVLALDVVVPASAAVLDSIVVLIDSLDFGIAGTVMFRLDSLSLQLQASANTQADDYGLEAMNQYLHANQLVLKAGPVPGDFSGPEVMLQYYDPAFGPPIPAEGAVVGSAVAPPTSPALVTAPELQWRGRLQLGESMLFTAARAQQPRLTMKRADVAVHVRTRLMSLPPLSGGGFEVNVYRSWDGVIDERMEIVSNAVWNSGTSQWDKITPAVSASRFYMTPFGIVSQSVDAAVASWADAAWDDAPYQTAGKGGWSVQHRQLLSNNGFVRIVNPQTAGAFPGNPSATTAPLTNALYAKNIPKAWGTIFADTVTANILEGFNVASATLDAFGIHITMGTGMANLDYSVVVTANNNLGVSTVVNNNPVVYDTVKAAITVFDVKPYNSTTGFFRDPLVFADQFHFVVYARQG